MILVAAPSLADATAGELIEHCELIGVRLYLDGGKLRFNAPKGAVGPELHSAVGKRKAEIIARLGSPWDSTPDAPSIAPRPDYPRDLLTYARRLGVRFHLADGVLTWHDPLGETEPCEGLDEALAEHRDALAEMILDQVNAENRHPSVTYGPDSILAD